MIQIYVSLENSLLFPSGSWDVNSNGEKAITELSKVLSSQTDLQILVEGHTDNVPYVSEGMVKDNWDLSVKRSTSIVRVLETLDVNPQKLIAAGRSYHVPLVDNETATNRSINRRTRIVVLPKIDQFYDMIEKEMKSMTE